MCSATCVLYRIPRLVIGENTSFMGGEDMLRASGAEIINLDNAECKKMMADWIKGDGRDIWWEDIGLLGEEEKA
jgi:creatinine deaminase